MTKIIRLLFYLILIIYFIPASSKSNESPNILIINSNHKGFTFADKITAGIASTLNRVKSKSNLYYEYLDLMRVRMDNDQIESLIRFLANKYKNINFDAIICTDYEALSFAVKIRDAFKKEIPIIFCGILPGTKQLIENEKNVYGIYFDYDFRLNLDLAGKLFPNRNKYIIIHDSTLFGLSFASAFKALEAKYPGKSFLYINNFSLDEMAAFIETNSSDAVVFPLIYNHDRYGNTYTTEDLTNLLSNKIDAPMFGFLDFQSNRGILGGYLYIGYRDGERTAKLTNQIIEKGRIPDTAFQRNPVSNPVFMYDKLEKFNIPEDILPEKAIVASRPVSYYQQYMKVLIPYIILIFSLLVFITILTINMSKRKKISNELQKSEQRFRLLTSNAKDIIFRFELYPTGHFSYISPSVKNILGIEPEIIYHDYFVYEKYLDPDSKNILKYFGTGNLDFSKNIELHWILNDHKDVWTEEKYQPIYDSENILIAFEGVSRDITERKKSAEALRLSRERLSLVLEGSKDGTWDWDIITGEIVIDHRWAEMLGYFFEEIKPSYDSWIASIHPDDSQEAQRLLNLHLNGEADHYEAEFRFKTKSNGYKWILSRGKVVLKDSNGKALRMTGTHTDITEKKRNESELLKVQKLESLGTLAGGIAHDFNNILTSIMGNISLAKLLIESSKDLNKISTLLINSEKATFRAKELTLKLLTFSRGGNPVKKTSQPENIINESVSSLNLPSMTPEIRYLSKPWIIEVDSDQMKQALISIMTNAAESMNNSGVIKIVVRNYKVNHRLVQNPALNKDYYVRIDIIDHGSGIAKENLDKVFDPYFTTKPKAGGLGLSSAYAIIKNHAGHISLSSIPGRGTTVTIYIPAIIESLNAKQEVSKSSSMSKAKILVMDDDAFIRELLYEALTNFGYEVELTTDGDETIKKYSESLDSGSPYDLLIMDLTIPGGKGGKETIIELKAMDPDIRALVSSGYSNDPILSNFEEYGFKGIISKPYNMDILKDTIKAVLG